MDHGGRRLRVDDGKAPRWRRRSLLPDGRAPRGRRERPRQLRARRHALSRLAPAARQRRDARRPFPRLGSRRTDVVGRARRAAAPPERSLRERARTPTHRGLARGPARVREAPVLAVDDVQQPLGRRSRSGDRTGLAPDRRSLRPRSRRPDRVLTRRRDDPHVDDRWGHDGGGHSMDRGPGAAWRCRQLLHARRASRRGRGGSAQLSRAAASSPRWPCPWSSAGSSWAASCSAPSAPSARGCRTS